MLSAVLIEKEPDVCDVHMENGHEGHLVCRHCELHRGKDVRFFKYSEAIAHLHEHRFRGDKVPESAFNQLRMAEFSNGNSMQDQVLEKLASQPTLTRRFDQIRKHGPLAVNVVNQTELQTIIPPEIIAGQQAQAAACRA